MDHLKQLIAEWIRFSRKAAGLTLEELGDALALDLGEGRGYSKQNISHWENQRNSPNLKQLMSISKTTMRPLPDDVVVAMGGRPAEAREIGAAHVIDVRAYGQPVRVVEGPPSGAIAIKLMNVSLRAGLLHMEPTYDLTFGGELHIPVEVLSRLQLDPAHLIAFPVKGRSGEPMFFEDDIAVVDTRSTKLINRELFAVLFNDEACIKQLLHRGGQWYLHSLNPDPEFGDVNVRSGELKIIGRVVYQPGRMVTGRL